jgi:prepilin-type N-terminal cleavage/methylation domain-containing protein
MSHARPDKQTPFAPCRRENGFTLIELLVVIAIISLLVSILLPSLNQAKELAKRASCQANLHSIGLAVNLYAGEYDGYVPPHAVNLLSGFLSSPDYPDLPWRSYAAYWSDSWAESFNLAILNEKEFVGTGKLFYCPSMESEYHSWDSSAQNGYTMSDIWEMSPEDRHATMTSSMAVRTSYMYKPYNPANWLSGRKYEFVLKTIEDIPAEATLVLDVAYTATEIAHADAPGWNLLSAAGDVRFSKDDWAADYMTTTSVASTWGSWYDRSYFRGVLRSLEEN